MIKFGQPLADVLISWLCEMVTMMVPRCGARHVRRSDRLVLPLLLAAAVLYGVVDASVSSVSVFVSAQSLTFSTPFLSTITQGRHYNRKCNGGGYAVGYCSVLECTVVWCGVLCHAFSQKATAQPLPCVACTSTSQSHHWIILIRV